MTTAADPEGNPETLVAACLADLEANAPPENVLARLRAMDGGLVDRPLLRARRLRAQAIAKHRLGYSEDALGDLHEARILLEGGGEHHELAAIFRAIAVVHSWRGD